MASPKQLLDEALGFHRAGRLGDAALRYRAILEQDQNNPDALHMLGTIAAQMGRLQESLPLLDAALTVKPDLWQAYLNKAKILHALKHLPEAIAMAEQAVKALPADADAHTVLGLALRDGKETAKARQMLQKAVRLAPNAAAYRLNLGVVLAESGALEDAIESYTEAIYLDPDSAEAHNNLGNAQKDAGRPDLAIASYNEALKIDPQLQDAAVNLALAHLLIGDYSQGFEKFERRSRPQETPTGRYDPMKRWNGQGSPQGRIVLHAEQGFGDTIQFLRYAPWVAERVGHIILELPEELRTLARSLPLPHTFASAKDPLPEHEWQCPLPSLPRIFATRADRIPAPIPYLEADAARKNAWALRLGEGAALCVGLVWAGNPGHLNDRNRSISFSELAPILETAGAQFYSLQKGNIEKFAQDAMRTDQIKDFAEHLQDFSETACALANLDLLITVDTSVAHLAGALGRPVWLLLPFCPDWRWMFERTDSPWYPTFRLFRQKKPQQWRPVMEEVSQALARLAAGDQTVLRPREWLLPPPQAAADALF